VQVQGNATSRAGHEPPWALGLNPAQRRAVEHGDQPLLVVAGAGTGKTRMLVSRVARLLDASVPPERILLVTFSRRAAAELIRRVGHLTDAATARRVDAGTFHAVAHRVLRRHGAALGLDRGFSVLDAGDARDLLGLVRAPVAAATRRRFPRTATVAAVYDRVVSSRRPLEEVVTREFPWCAEAVDGLRTVFSDYTDRKRAQNLLDFEDLLLFWLAAARDPSAGPVLAGAYDHILVDEYQDTSVAQREILQALRATDGRITAVGDDAQAIYSFRSATVRNILDFPSQFDNARTVTLERNYRSSGPILDLANAVMAAAAERYEKNLWTAEPGGARPTLATCPDAQAQAEAVCDSILELHESGVLLREQAVLFRSSHHSDLVEMELGRRGIPFVKYGGLRFLEAAHVRDLLGCLRLMANPWDELAWLRVLRLADGVGPATAQRAVERLDVRGCERGAPDPLTTFCKDPSRVVGASRAVRDLTLLSDALAACRSERLSPAAQVECLRQALDPIVRRRYDRPEARLADLDALARIADGYADRDHLVAELTLDPPSSTGDLAGPPSLDDDWLTLSTVHSAKGAEWSAVHLIHAADGAFPSDMATGDQDGIDEERRLFYVALTRARRHLHIYAPLRFHHGAPDGWRDAHSYAQRTRFLPPSADALLEHRAVRSAADVATSALFPALTGTVDADLRTLWAPG
jgi:DNA helicase-2/ATP-dependent DNA helicase PcrA